MATWDTGGSSDTLDEQLIEAVVDEAYEVQTYQPFHGWVYDRFCDRTGHTFPVLSRAIARVGGTGGHLNDLKEEKLDAKEVGVLPSDEWMWSHPWLPDIEHCDEEGWTYGSTFARINRRLAGGTLKLKREYYHFVRRRRWIRTRVRKPTLVAHGQALTSAAIVDGRNRDRDSDHGVAPTTHFSFQSSTDSHFYYAYPDSMLAHFVASSHSPSTSKLLQLEVKAYEDHDVLCQDWLGQRGSLSRSWKLRYFILLKKSSKLVCLRDCATRVAIWEIPIGETTSTMLENSPNPNQFQFLVINGQHTIRLNALDGRAREKWLLALTELIVRRRKSFLEADESDTGQNSTRGLPSARGFRKQRYSAADDGRASRPPFGKTISRSLSWDVTERSHQPKPAWRPYKLVSATMQDKRDTNKKRRIEYLKAFETEFVELVEVAREFLDDNIDVLEANLRVAEQVLTSAVVRVPQDELKKLRENVDESMTGMTGRLQKLLASNHANVLQCNMLRKALHEEAKRLNDTTLSFAPPVGQATVKKIAPESPSKRRIPTDWFMGPTSITSDTDSSHHKSGLAEIQPVVSVVSRPYDLASSDSASSIGMMSSRRKRSSVDSSMSTFLNSTVLQTTFAGKSEPVTIQAFRTIPSILGEGHLELPDGVNGYVFLVHEHDLGSLIAFTLCSKAYVEAVESHFEPSLSLGQELKVEEYALGRPVDVKPDGVHMSTKAELAYVKKLAAKDDVQHTEVKFAYDSSSTKHDFRCVSFFASQFHALRALTGHGNVDFLSSLAQSKRAESSGGKSGAYFSMTHDKRYVLKGIPMTEFNMFVHMAPHYFQYMSSLRDRQEATVITKILGLYKLTHTKKMHKHTTYVVVMENISYGFSPGQTYDIKGITRRRYRPDYDDLVESCGSTPRIMMHDRPVLLDGNLIERIPVPVRKADLDVVEPAYQRDTNFLSQAGVVDYSLLMLFDEENRQVIVGLIDYLHQYDFLKKMESTSKASLTFRNPTIISPSSYQTRFVNAMHRYLVGIELEVELRIRKRKDKSGAKNSNHKLLANGSTTAVKDSNGDKVMGSLPALSPSKVPKKRAQRATSTGAVLNINHDSFDHDAARAHSEGEEYDSDVSDEGYVRQDPAVYGVLMPVMPQR